MSDVSSVGGAADEQGSRHRNGFAAYLAVHGLVGLPIEGRPGAIPIRLHLEAGTAVDDIVCTMQDATTWFIQSKRTAGNDRALRDAILQWTAQDLAQGDRVALVSRELKGLLRDLQPLIDRVASDRGAVISSPGRDRLEQLVGLLEQGGSKDGAGLLPRIVFFKAAVEDLADAEQANAIALLAGTIVHAADAPAAFEALRSHMQLVATRREWTGVDDWIAAIAAAGIQIYADGTGAPGARAEARRQATTLYRDVLASRRDMLDLSNLRPGLGLIPADGLLGGWEVEWGDADDTRYERRANLLAMVRRNSRFILTGHPGIGKSEALRQIAAELAADAHTPLPIHIDLRDVIGSVEHAQDITLDLLLQRPSRSVALADPADVLAMLRASVIGGEAVLLVDGLDETRRRRGAVALGLHKLLESLPESTGFILSTRPSALDATRVLGIEAVRLKAPRQLEDSLRGILSVVAQNVDPAKREDWLAERLDVLRRTSEESKDIWKIPLLASLATLRIGGGLDPDVSPAHLLNDVVDDSVKAWEELKATHKDGLDPEMRGDILLDGFVVIGRLINERGSVSGQEVRSALGEHLIDWAPAARLRAILVDQIIHFWDERVGIFIEHEGELTARSRQFAELADVRWITTRPVEAQEAWLAAALADSDRMHTVRLAAMQSEVLRDALVAASRRGGSADARSRAIDWLADFWAAWSDLDDAANLSIIDALADAAQDALPIPERGTGIIERIGQAQRRHDGGGWHCVLALAKADLSGEPAERVRERLAGLALSGARQQLVDLLIGLRDADRRSRMLTAGELESIERILGGPHPAASTREELPDGVISFNRSEYFVTGVDEVIRLAVAHIDELPDDAPDAFYAIVHDLPAVVYRHVENVLVPRGHFDPHPFGAFKAPLAEWKKSLEDFHGFGWALRALSDLYPNDETGSVAEMWRNTQLTDFIDSLGWGDSTIPALREAASEDARFIAIWFAAAIEAYGFDGPLIATQARTILADSADERDFLSLITTRSLSPRDRVTGVDCETATALAVGFASKSIMIVEHVFGLVLNADCPGVADVVKEQTDPMTWRARYLATLAAIANAGDRAAWLAKSVEAGSPQRAALATILPQLEGDNDVLAAALAQDRDATVRVRADGDPTGATEWTCTRCYQVRKIDEIPCPECNQHPSWSKRVLNESG